LASSLRPALGIALRGPAKTVIGGFTKIASMIALSLTSALAAACAANGGGSTGSATAPAESSAKAAPPVASKLDRTRNWEVGDKLTFN